LKCAHRALGVSLPQLRHTVQLCLPRVRNARTRQNFIPVKYFTAEAKFNFRQ